jgi:hypothetical protein
MDAADLSADDLRHKISKAADKLARRLVLDPAADKNGKTTGKRRRCGHCNGKGHTLAECRKLHAKGPRPTETSTEREPLQPVGEPRVADEGKEAPQGVPAEAADADEVSEVVMPPECQARPIALPAGMEDELELDYEDDLIGFGEDEDLDDAESVDIDTLVDEYFEDMRL